MTTKLTVQVWHDLICPMCPIGRVAIEKAVSQFEHRDDLQIVYRSFRLRPGIAPHTVDAYLKHKYGRGVSVASTLGRVEQMGAAAGLTYKMANTMAGDTMNAHRVVHFAKAHGLQLPMVKRLQIAHFSEEANLFDTPTLVRLASEIGLDRDEVASMLGGDALKDDVEADELAARSRDINSIPSFLVNDQIPARGGQTPEQFLSILNHAWGG